MTAGELIANLEMLAEAPDGVPRLRELVLQLAVHGKLLEQDSADEPATALIGRIAVERRDRRVERRTANRLPNGPRPLPTSWCWVNFGDIFDCRLGKMLDKAKNRGQLRKYLRNANVRWGAFDLSDLLELRVMDEEAEAVSVSAGDLVICEGGEPGRAAVWSEKSPIVIQKALHRARPYLVNSRYYQLHLRHDCVSGRIGNLFTGATIKHLTGQMLARHVVSLPPLPEQHRIVAKVDELMSLLDRLDAARKARETARTASRDSALQALRDATTPDQVQTAWTRVANHLDDLITNPADIEPLRQTILQLAVRGRLVPQDPNDEPTCNPLTPVAEVERHLVSASGCANRRRIGGAVRSVASFAAPKNWRWVHLKEIAIDLAYGTSARSRLTGRVPVLRMGNLQRRRIEWTDLKYTDDPEEIAKFRLAAGDVLFNRTNSPALVGKTAVYRGEREAIYAGYLIRIRLTEQVDPDFVNLVLTSPYGRRWCWENRTDGVSQSNISGSRLQLFSLPIPPIAEQRRIGSKVDEMMDLIDRLEGRLVAFRDAQAGFARAAVHRLTNSTRTSGGGST